MRTRRDNERNPVVHTLAKKEEKKKRNVTRTVLSYFTWNVKRRSVNWKVTRQFRSPSSLWFGANRGSILNNRRRSASRRHRDAEACSYNVTWRSLTIFSKNTPKNTSYERYRILAIKTDSLIFVAMINSSHFVSSLFWNDYIPRSLSHSLHWFVFSRSLRGIASY